MAISCGCDFDDYGSEAVGKARIVIARAPRQCSDCVEDINTGDTMYVQSFFDFSEYQPRRPRYMCERCGDLIESLAEQGFCFEYGYVLNQWREYLDEREESGDD